MRDGVLLRADISHPAQEGRYAVLLCRTHTTGGGSGSSTPPRSWQTEGRSAGFYRGKVMRPATTAAAFPAAGGTPRVWP